MKNVYLRADGNSEIGLGHLIRCIALAQMIKSEFNIHFIFKDAPDQIIQDILRNGFRFTKIDNEFVLFSLLNERDIVIIDHYDLDLNYQKNIKALGCKVVCIDDLHDKPFVADLIINHAPGVQANDYIAKPYTKFALGPKFALLRPEFIKISQKKLKHEINRRLLICFGGADFNNLTCKSIESIYINKFFEEIHVITGVSYLFRNQLNRLIKLDDRIKLHKHQNAEGMLRYMKKCHYVLAPASSIAYEILSAGCTWLGGYYVENQKKIYEGFKQMNCLVDFGNLNKNLPFLLPEYNDMHSIDLNNNNPIDGKSNLRLKNIFSALC
jgi:UDP-2,4-diacetamido-2,4,6-trideoxy-beta-L-altropyranose hydrolase